MMKTTAKGCKKNKWVKSWDMLEAKNIFGYTLGTQKGNLRRCT